MLMNYFSTAKNYFLDQTILESKIIRYDQPAAVPQLESADDFDTDVGPPLGATNNIVIRKSFPQSWIWDAIPGLV